MKSEDSIAAVSNLSKNFWLYLNHPFFIWDGKSNYLFCITQILIVKRRIYFTF